MKDAPVGFKTPAAAKLGMKQLRHSMMALTESLRKTHSKSGFYSFIQ